MQWNDLLAEFKEDLGRSWINSSTFIVFLLNYIPFLFLDYIHYYTCLETPATDPDSNKYKLFSIILDIAHH